MMKPTGVVRRLDNLGRVVIPREICRKFHIDKGDPVEFYVDDKGIFIRKYDSVSDMGEFLESVKRSIQMGEAWVPPAKMDKLLKKLAEMEAVLKE